MNTSLTVRLKSDTNYIPVKYRVVEMTVGSSDTTTFCALSVVRVGWDTSDNYDKWVSTRSYDTNAGTTTLVGRDPEGMQGTLGNLSVATLDTITEYSAVQTPSVDQ